MNQDFQLETFISYPSNQRVFFSYYLKKHNESIEVGDAVCEIRIGNYKSVFRYDLIIIKSPASGFLIHTLNIDDILNANDIIFSISDNQKSETDLKFGESFSHHFPGESLVYTFGGWSKKQSSYVKANDLLYTFSNVQSQRFHYAEKSGRLTITPPKIPFLNQNQLLYTIEFSEPFENEQTVEQIFNSCFVYLMKDITNGYYKIGISSNPTYREKTLQSEKPTIELIISKEYPIREIAESFEKALHKSFENKRIRGEWFSLNEQDAENIKASLK